MARVKTQISGELLYVKAKATTKYQKQHFLSPGNIFPMFSHVYYGMNKCCVSHTRTFKHSKPYFCAKQSTDVSESFRREIVNQQGWNPALCAKVEEAENLKKRSIILSHKKENFSNFYSSDGEWNVSLHEVSFKYSRDSRGREWKVKGKKNLVFERNKYRGKLREEATKIWNAVISDAGEKKWEKKGNVYVMSRECWML